MDPAADWAAVAMMAILLMVLFAAALAVVIYAVG